MEHGRIAEVGEGTPTGMDRRTTLDVGENYVLPGFWDIHSHGAGGRDVCDGLPDSLEHIARHKRAEGVTTWLPTTTSSPWELLLETLRRGCGGADFPCRTPGFHVEGPFLNPTMAGAQNPAHLLVPDRIRTEQLLAAGQIAILSLAPELDGALDLIRHVTRRGIVCSGAHTDATCPQLTSAVSAGLKHLTHFGNAMRGLHHREIGVLGAGLLLDSLCLELICDGHHLSDDMLALLFRMVPVERLMLITDSMSASWLGDGPALLGGLEIEVASGRAVLRGTDTLAGSTLRYDEGFRRALRVSGLPPEQLVKATSWNQARSLGIHGFGKLEPGFTADLVWMDPDWNLSGTLLAGQFHSNPEASPVP